MAKHKIIKEGESGVRCRMWYFKKKMGDTDDAKCYCKKKPPIPKKALCKNKNIDIIKGQISKENCNKTMKETVYVHKDCVGKTSCKQKVVTKKNCKKFVPVKCKHENFTTKGSKEWNIPKTIPRNVATSIFVYSDMLICVFFFIFTQSLIKNTERDQELVRQNTIKLTDFSIEIVNLPDL